MQLEQMAGSQSTALATAAFRKPKRISITVPESVYDELINRSMDEGRSLSNLAANMIERHIREGGR